MKAYEITTVYTLKGISKMFIGKYMVIARSTSAANSLVPLREGEEIVHAEELNHHVVVEEYEHST